jgi:hypothetical protein
MRLKKTRRQGDGVMRRERKYIPIPLLVSLSPTLLVFLIRLTVFETAK